jgi:putative ABC transport system ATP-binding protein
MRNGARARAKRAAIRMEHDPALPVLELRDLRRHFHVGDEVVRAVDGVSLAIDAGTVVALYGPSGSGKSTLLRIAAGAEPADSGTVCVGGIDVAALSERDAATYRMHLLGWIDQEPNLIDGGTALDNAAFKLLCAGWSLRDARREATALLAAVGFSQRDRQRADTLSMGERQRVMIARALSLGPRVLLADEPTGNLDTVRTHEVLSLLRAVTHERGMATLLVTHDEAAAEYADRVYHLQDGVLSELTPGAGTSA